MENDEGPAEASAAQGTGRDWWFGYGGIAALLVGALAMVLYSSVGPLWFALLVLPLLVVEWILIGRVVRDAPPAMKTVAQWAMGTPAATALLVAVPFGVGAIGGLITWRLRANAEEQCTKHLTDAKGRLEQRGPGGSLRALDDARKFCDVSHAAEIASLSEKAKALLVVVEAEQVAAQTAETDRLRALYAARMESARGVWTAYDRLPAREQQKPALLIAMTEAHTHERDLAPELEGAVHRFNGTEARKRMAPLITPGSKARGDRAEILVPSSDAATCIVMGSQWSQDVDSLRAIGFERIHCDGWSYKSGLTGKLVEEPARDWDVR